MASEPEVIAWLRREAVAYELPNGFRIVSAIAACDILALRERVAVTLGWRFIDGYWHPPQCPLGVDDPDAKCRCTHIYLLPTLAELCEPMLE